MHRERAEEAVLESVEELDRPAPGHSCTCTVPPSRGSQPRGPEAGLTGKVNRWRNRLQAFRS